MAWGMQSSSYSAMTMGAAFSPQAGQQRGQKVPRWNTGWCIFSARPPQLLQAAVTIPD